MNDAEHSMRLRHWWQRQRMWLLGILVLGGWALYAPYRDARDADRRNHPDSAMNVSRGAWAHYEGAQWRLLGMDTLPTPGGRSDAMVLVARFVVVPDAGTVASSLDRCIGRLSDAQGHRWLAENTHRLNLRLSLPTSCGSGLDAQIQRISAMPHQPWRFVMVYQVPRSVDSRTLRPEIVLPWLKHSPNGSFLSFQR